MNGVWIGIVVLVRTRKNVQPRTLDVRQIRRTVLGIRKAPGMKSNCGEVYTDNREASSPHNAPAQLYRTRKQRNVLEKRIAAIVLKSGRSAQV